MSFLVDIHVSKEHPHFTVVDGVLYSKDLAKIICYPCARKGALKTSDQMKVIESQTFYGCSLTSIEITENVTHIEGWAFGSYSVNSIIFHSGAVKIDYDAFENCLFLSEVHFLVENPADIEFSLSVFDPLSDKTLFVPMGTEDAYRNDSRFNGFKEIRGE